MYSIGFIGGGRIVRILLQAIQNRQHSHGDIVISDPNEVVLKELAADFPDMSISAGTNSQAAGQDVVFLAIHPPVFKEVLAEIAPAVQNAKAVVSLAPVLSADKISAMLNGYKKIARIIPNAATFINKGYNPAWFSDEIDKEAKIWLLEFFGVLGESPIVDEEKLEAYAIVTAMGPTYLWPQLNELHKLAIEFGLDETETIAGMKSMISGTADLLYNSGLNYEKVVDLIPVKPLGEHEAEIRGMYKTKLTGLFNKLKGR